MAPRTTQVMLLAKPAQIHTASLLEHLLILLPVQQHLLLIDTAAFTVRSSAQVKTTTIREMESIVPHSTSDAAASSSPTSAAADPWIQLGAKPKAPADSTPSHPELWSAVQIF